MSRLRRTSLLVFAALVPVLGLSACAKTHVDRFAVNDQLAKVVLDVGAGNVTINGTNDMAVSVQRTVHQRGRKASFSQTTEAGVLTLTSRCSGGLFRSCRVDHDLSIPTHLPVEVRASSGSITIGHVQETVDVRTDSGAIHLSEPGGRVTARTASGDLEVDRASDDLTLETGSGAIRATNLTTGIVKATTRSGRISMLFEDAPDDVDLHTGSGAISVKVPPQSYKVEPSTSSGQVTVKGLKEGAVGGTIKAASASGDISIEGSS